MRDTTQAFVQDQGSNLYRRSMYTLWKRTNPPPAMATFDAPNRELCVMNRESTNTPLQALVLLNDVQFVEASRRFAQRLLADASISDDASRLAIAFEAFTSRPPSDAELDTLLAALREQRRQFEADPEMARALLEFGEHPRDPSQDPVEHAAYTQTVNLVMNLSETITKP